MIALKFEFWWLLIWIGVVILDVALAEMVSTKPLIGHILKGHDAFRGMSHQKLLIAAVVIAPIFEELAFRGFMNFKRHMISLSLAAFVCLSLRVFFNLYFPWWSLLVIGLVVFLTALFALKKAVVYEYVLGKKRIIFYTMSMLFAFVHLHNFNIEVFSGFYFLLIPFAVFPQFVGSISLAYVRLKNGLSWSIALHSFFNFCVVGIYILGSLGANQ